MSESLPTALSYIDHRHAMCIYAFDAQGNIAARWSKDGARYIYRITYEEGTVVFTGQSYLTISFRLEELVVPPSVQFVDPSARPPLPKALSYLSSNPASFPMIALGPYRFWPTSYTDGRDGFAVVVTDLRQVLRYIIRCPGARCIQDVIIDSNSRHISLLGEDGMVANLPYESVTVAYDCRSVFTWKDLTAISSFLFSTNDMTQKDLVALEQKMPAVTCATCCSLAQSELPSKYQLKSYSNVGSAIGAVMGALSGFLIGDIVGAKAGALIGISAGSGIGGSLGTPAYPFPSMPSELERTRTMLRLVNKHIQILSRSNRGVFSYTSFPVGPFANVGIADDLFSCRFDRYQSSPWSSAVATVSPSRAWHIYKPWRRIFQAYYPRSGTIDGFPHTSPYSSQILFNGDKIVKYVFVIVEPGHATVGNFRAYQMRTHPAEFYPSAIDAKHRTNRSYIFENFHFYCLVGHISEKVYGAGTMYVNSTQETIVGLDTRSAHSFVSFNGQDHVVAEAALDFLSRLGYDTSDMRLVDEMWMWAMDNMNGMV